MLQLGRLSCRGSGSLLLSGPLGMALVPPASADAAADALWGRVRIGDFLHAAAARGESLLLLDCEGPDVYLTALGAVRLRGRRLGTSTDQDIAVPLWGWAIDPAQWQYFEAERGEASQEPWGLALGDRVDAGAVRIGRGFDEGEESAPPEADAALAGVRTSSLLASQPAGGGEGGAEWAAGAPQPFAAGEAAEPAMPGSIVAAEPAVDACEQIVPASVEAVSPLIPEPSASLSVGIASGESEISTPSASAPTPILPERGPAASTGAAPASNSAQRSDGFLWAPEPSAAAEAHAGSAPEAKSVSFWEPPSSFAFTEAGASSMRPVSHVDSDPPLLGAETTPVDPLPLVPVQGTPTRAPVHSAPTAVPVDAVVPRDNPEAFEETMTSEALARMSHEGDLEETVLRRVRSVEPTTPSAFLIHGGGAPIEVVRDVVIGRDPDPRAITGRPAATILRVLSPAHEISRSHCAVMATGPGTWSLMDLGSANGTVLRRANGVFEDVTPVLSIPLADGDLIDVGESTTIEFRIQ